MELCIEYALYSHRRISIYADWHLVVVVVVNMEHSCKVLATCPWASVQEPIPNRRKIK